MVEFLYVLAVVFFAAAAHPYVTYPLSLLLLPRRKSKPPRPGWRKPTVAICMSAYNEARVIVPKVEALLAMAQAYGPAKICIYVDGATDGTAELLRPYADRVTVLVSQERRGKTAGLKQLIASADAEVLAFTDANVAVPAEALQELVESLDDDEVCCASARLVYVNKAEAGISTAGAMYWRFEEFIKSLESERVGMIGVDGAFFVIDRAAYVAPPDELIDDLYVSMRALLTGRRVVSIQSVLVEERSASHWAEEFRRKVRISCQAMNVHRALWPDLQKASPVVLYCYLSHRFLKWMTPFSLLLGAASLFAGLSLSFGVMRPLAGLALLTGGLVLGAWVNLPYFRVLATSVVSLGGVACGQFEALLMRRTYTIWNPAPTVRN